jgi:hypothetical protein
MPAAVPETPAAVAAGPVAMPVAVQPAAVSSPLEPTPVAAELPAAGLPAVDLLAHASASSSWPFAPVTASSPLPPAVQRTPVQPIAQVDAPPLSFDSNVPYQPFGMIPKVSAGATSRPERANTVSVWLIVILPLVMVGVAVLVVTQLGDYYTLFMQGALLFLFALLTIALGVRDRRELDQAGHPHPASPAWLLLTPLAYLVARTVAVRRTARGEGLPLLVWVLVVAGIAVAAFLVPGEWISAVVTTTGVI